MLKNIINTVFVRVFGAIITLTIVIINANTIGAEGMGEISLIILAVSIFLLLNGVVSGALVYFVPRENIFKLLLISYLWTIITILVFISINYLYEIAPGEYFIHIVFLAIILSLSNINEKVLIGKEKIITVNYIAVVKIISLILSLITFYYILGQKVVFSYIFSLYISYGLGFVFTFLYSAKFVSITKVDNLLPLFRKVFKLSGYNAVAAIVQKLNYRLSYYLIEYFLGMKALGIFSVGVQISESTLIIGRSISFVQYSKIANLKDSKKAIEITVLLVKLILILSSVTMLILSVFPSSVYSMVFGKEFTNINFIIMSLALGIIALSVTMIISPYFSGTGNQRLNAQSAFAGFIVTLAAGLILIPKYNILGAGYTATLSYLVSMIYQVYLFKNQTKITLSVFKIKKQDIDYGLKTLKTLFKK